MLLRDQGKTPPRANLHEDRRAINTDSIIEIEEPRFGSKVHLCYAPDGSRLLINDKLVVDGATHAVIYSIPARQDPMFGEFADADHVIQIYKVNRQYFFNSTLIPKDLAAKTVAVVKSGGKSEDGGLQPLFLADWSTTVTISHVNIPQAPWAVKPVPVPPRGKPVPFFPQHTPSDDVPIQPRESQHAVSALLFTSRDAHTVFIEHVERNGTAEGGALHQTFTWIERDDLIGGTGNSVMVVPKVLQAMDCSSTGKTLIFRGGSANWIELIFIFPMVPPSSPPSLYVPMRMRPSYRAATPRPACRVKARAQHPRAFPIRADHGR